VVIDDSKPICLGSTSELPIRSNHYPWLLMSVWEPPLLITCLLIVSAGFHRQGVQPEQE